MRPCASNVPPSPADSIGPGSRRIFVEHVGRGCKPRQAWTLAIACALTALAGLLIGTVGQWGPLPRVDWYHLALTAANLGFGWALGRSGMFARAG